MHLDHALGRVRVQRKAIRHLYLRLDPADGTLRVSAPRRATEHDILAFVSSRHDWIVRQRDRLAQRPAVLQGEGLPGTLQLLGVEHAVSLRPDDGGGTRGRVSISSDGILVSARDGAHGRDLLRRHCRNRFKALLEERVPRWADQMGLPHPETRIRRMTSRWGSCNIRDRRIWLNLELIRLPVEAIDLVIVHELAHLIERGHNPRFYGVMDRAYPDWRRWEATLSEYGIIGL